MENNNNNNKNNNMYNNIGSPPNYNNRNNNMNYNSPNIPNNNNNPNYNYNNMYNNIMYNSDIDNGSNHYHDLLINNNNSLKSKRRFKFKVLSFVIAIFFIISISSLVFFIYFSTEQLTFKGFKFIETKCILESTRYTSRNETSGDCQVLNENEWWYQYDKDFYKFNNGNANINYSSSYSYGSIVGSEDTDNFSDNSDSIGKHKKSNIVCFQGIFNVSFNDTEKQLLNGDIYGIWSADLERIKSYLHLVKGGVEQTCFYNKHDNKEIIWIRPPSSLFNILLIVLLGLVSLLSFILFIVICRKAFGPLSKEEEKAKLLSNSIYYRYTSDNVYNLENNNNNNN
ncbi:hypothetical protein DICPUDRAFT_89219 [Dictyostelium purpureum]|uniref:Uncharacterized protein n=1 Tax=Dictyostelium purpureum TaxID=5786 RepID=F0ZUF1_DICPU|nr:uncharacterized protein DICPUDRAFT_89219 [Dictyostelium purpureum]EGC32430.1 hypothetical protein DICPUDRAFT_89219 [Dictyostelium purpureum]|eukprot:XP_003291042.1 hypothetical protein DICPUDRAFT_89219 [Dictyostelium purpureum]